MTSRTWAWRYYSVSPLIFFHRTRSSCCVVNASFLLHYERTFPRNAANIVYQETKKFRWLHRRSSFVKFVPKTLDESVNATFNLALLQKNSFEAGAEAAKPGQWPPNGTLIGVVCKSPICRVNSLEHTVSMRANEARQARLSYDTTYGRQVGRCR